MNLGPLSTSWLEDKLLRLFKVMDEGYHPWEDTRDNSLCIIRRMGERAPQGAAGGRRVTAKTSKNAPSGISAYPLVSQWNIHFTSHGLFFCVCVFFFPNRNVPPGRVLNCPIRCTRRGFCQIYQCGLFDLQARYERDLIRFCRDETHSQLFSHGIKALKPVLGEVCTSVVASRLSGGCNHLHLRPPTPLR